MHPLLRAATEKPRRVVGCGIHPLRFEQNALDTTAKALLGQLPPHAVDDRGGIERPRMQPHPVAAVPPVPGEHDPQFGADEVQRPEP